MDIHSGLSIAGINADEIVDVEKERDDVGT
jgi:hypothetical protein